jgi:hypothetical protein
MISKSIIYFGKSCILACDAKCEKAWGMNSRPRDDDEIELPDSVLGIAPIDPGTYEGFGDDGGKPTCEEERLNKWCARECERSDIKDKIEDIVLPVF